MDIKKIKEILKDEPKFRLKQVYEAIFQKFIDNWDEATVLSLALREKLKAEAPLDIAAQIFESSDKKTVKAAINFSSYSEKGRGGIVEAVLMRHEDRNTVCVSSQIGCLLGCDFCLTGKMGFIRNLDSYEIVEQVLFFARYLKKQTSSRPSPCEGEGERVTNVVFMGMGEPFLNYNEVLKAVRFLNDKDTFNIGARKISISTAGIIDGIKKFSNEDLQVNLAVSLHAPNDALRNAIMPVSKNNPLKNLLRALRSYIEKTNRKVMIEYVMLGDVNDSESHAQELGHVLRENLGQLFMVNLISYNETEGYDSSSAEAINKFKKVLEDMGIEVSQRFKLGREIEGACGQLAIK